ncbi:hypothetical protein OTERR_02530 [Oryzomicrobium terrae]|uniref:DUF2157 domain-containing protein n=1 Tax=Oryzomicrobium terrae TaxID=1735038 RepID=A0A5C1E5A4_9RHOO|nr:hypothetical protein [Oryzomicrobium terrae]QEL63729.1 hypothetical protein OTERR_02530 [Oryzomicrobium terrae]
MVPTDRDTAAVALSAATADNADNAADVGTPPPARDAIPTIPAADLTPLLDAAAAAGLLARQQVGPLAAFLAPRLSSASPSSPAGNGESAGARFKAAHILYYLGGMLAIGAASLFLTVGFAQLGGAGMALIAALYAVAAYRVATHFLGRGLRVPAGILATLVVVLVPLATYGLLLALGFDFLGRSYPQYHARIDPVWLVLEVVTLAVGAGLLQRLRLPFMVMPVAVTLWYMSMDLAALLLASPNLAGLAWADSWRFREQFSLVFGLLTLGLAFWVDLRSRFSRPGEDFAFWLHLAGLLAFWGGLSSLDSGSEWGRFAYAMINLGLIIVGTLLVRRAYVVFGGLGLAFYLGYLAHRVFRDSLLFPFALTLLGLGIIALGLVWQRHQDAWRDRLLAALPGPLAELLRRRQAEG